MIRRLFVDPGSNSAGWALFEGAELLCSGSVLANPKKSAFARSAEIGRKFQAQALEFQDLGLAWSESLLERVPNACAVQVHHAVGVIGAALSPYSNVKVEPTLIPSAWQKFCGWDRKVMNDKKVAVADVKVGNGLKLGSPLLPHLEKAASKDELAAIGLGLFYLNRNKNYFT
jgi:hypothetical protein